MLYDLVKFVPSKVVQQHTQPQQQPTNNVQVTSADVTDSEALPTVNEQQLPQDGNIPPLIVLSIELFCIVRECRDY